jgi:hypothetical protein
MNPPGPIQPSTHDGCSTPSPAPGTADGNYGGGNNITAANGALDVVGCWDGPAGSGGSGGPPYWYEPGSFTRTGINNATWLPLYSIVDPSPPWAIDVFGPIGADDNTELLLVDAQQQVHLTRCLPLSAACASGSNWRDQVFAPASGSFMADTVAGSAANPYASGQLNSQQCGGFDCAYQFVNGTWTQINDLLGSNVVQQVTVDVTSGDHKLWALQSDASGYYVSAYYDFGTIAGLMPVVFVGSGFQSGGAGYQLARIAVSNGQIWALAQAGVNGNNYHLFEYSWPQGSWIDHSADFGAPAGGMNPASLTMAPDSIPIVYVIEGTSGNQPNTVWRWRAGCWQ